MGSCLIVDSISVITLSKVPGFFQARILHSFANFCGSDSNRNYLFICFHSAMNYIHATRTDRRARCRWLLGAGREGMCFLSRAVSLNQTAHTTSTGVAVKVTKGLEYRFPPASVGLAVWGDRFTSLGPPHTLWVRAALRTSSASIPFQTSSLRQHFHVSTASQGIYSSVADREMLPSNLRIIGAVTL